jgi:hypothetical protein
VEREDTWLDEFTEASEEVLWTAGFAAGFLSGTF